jgi:hypothetical protein
MGEMRIRFGWLTIVGALLLFATLKMAAMSAQDEKPTIHPVRADHPPKLEDYLNPNAEPPGFKITEFLQREPHDGTPVSQETAAYISYDDRFLYVAFICKADPHTLRAHMVKREDIVGDDSVSVSLDTFHDGQRAYEFFANPLGIQLDGITAEGVEDDDFSFDTVWQSKGKITKDGYVVLFSIAFKSLRFHSRSKRASTWGIALGRVIPGNRELSTWPLLTTKMEAYVPQFANMDSPENAHSGRNIELTPYGFAGGEKFLDTTAAPPVVTSQPVYRGGIDAKVVIHDQITIDATVNPDFSQVESDESQVTTNQRYEVFFPEKRPFFLENSDYFSTPETLLFTRRIVDPQYGLRLTGKIGDWKVGFLGIDDRAPGQILSTSDPLFGDRAEIFAGRVQRVFNGGSSNVGLMFTRRQFGGNSTTVGSFDTRLKLGRNWIFTGQYMESMAQNSTIQTIFDPITGLPTGSLPNSALGRDLGSAIFAELKHVGRGFNWSTGYVDRTANFAGDDLGFFTRTDIRQLRESASYQWKPEGGMLTSVGPNFSGYATIDHTNVLQDWYADLPMVFNFKGPSSFSVGRTESYEFYQGIGFRKQASYGTFSTDKLRVVGLSAAYLQGVEINYFPAAGRIPTLGLSNEASAGLTFKPMKRLKFEERYIFSRLGDPASRTVILENHIARSKINFQASKPLSFRVIVDYNGLGGNPLLADLEHTRRFSYDALITYLIHPGTAFYIGYSDQYENLQIDPTDPLGLRRTPDFLNHLAARQFFVKLSYSFRM